jgi:DNA modification methylase
MIVSGAMMRTKLINGDCLEELAKLPQCAVDALITDPPAGISFMGKDWDGDKGGAKHWIDWMQSVAAQALRVMKPGAHGLVWAIPRTSHWTATALELAGFEIRDVVTHLFGSGFPKSHNIGKKLDDWEGWGTALKPASEHWILIRKPLSEKTVAKNVQRWGVGGINIDSCRVDYADEKDAKEGRSERKTTSKGQFAVMLKDDKFDRSDRSNINGRFPANLVLSGDAPEALDEQSGDLGKSQGGNSQAISKNTYSDFKNTKDNKPCGFGDSGGASRFFYCAKASKKERGEGNSHPTVKPIKLMEYLTTLITPPGGIILDPFMGSGSTALAAKNLGFDFVGIEAEAEYFQIAKGRIE